MENNDKDIDGYAAYVLKFILQYVKVSDRDFNLFLPLLELRSFPKREQVLKLGQVDDHLNLVVRGLARKYVVTDRTEKTLQLATEGHLIQSELSFHRRTPSTTIIETLEPTTFVSISYENVQRAFATISVAEQVGREMMTSLFIRKDRRYFVQLNNTTRQRFLHYLTQHPQMLQRVPQKILASYLEIKPETFSRLKHLLKS